ncbi:nickel transporter permease [Candidatus Contubernalis alkaliaceticus]|uniref:nickel transporter permease n=1 Tax=Candidatus Contubernalis alkaliaceticus TaxID=338645 RepID=UPI001F4BDD5E|nr:nickel transporter permease [Candidatus Contubernalis alkalaceticus]UNC93004.1 ABC transporter permease subunit [Candidatus Contubernalis alkalaceticus]
MACLGFIIIVIIVVVGLLAPLFSPHDPVKIDLSQRLQEPGGEFPLGTDHLGRCILSRIIHGTQVSLRTSFLVLVIIMTVGIFIGTLSGYIGGKLDIVVVSVIDVLLAFPGLILALAIAGMLGPSITNVMIAIASVAWVGYARIIRGMVVSIKEKEYVLAARSVGTTGPGIILRHVLPNVLSPVIVLATLDMGSIILSISGLSFLGLGAQPPMPEWGAMLNDGRPYMQTAPWLMIFPGLAILISVLSFNLMGDGLRDIFDIRGIRRL